MKFARSTIACISPSRPGSELVQVVGLDDTLSGLRRGIAARLRKAGKEYRVSLADLQLVEPDAESAEWLAMYRQ